MKLTRRCVSIPVVVKVHKTNGRIKLCVSVNIVIHNAWRLDFNLSLVSFEPNIRGTRNLIDLALRSRRASTLRFLFTSSIASSQGWDEAKGAFPEEVQYDASTAVGGGYGESKYVCERVRTHGNLRLRKANSCLPASC